MFTLVDYILFGVVGTCLVGGTLAVFRANGVPRYKALVFLIEAVIIAAMVGGCALYNTRTESGKRSVKSWQSETSGGIDRTVTVFDVDGEEIAKYTGRFDVEESSQEGVVKIKFDNQGKRHIIYAQTGTVLIDENEADQEADE